MEKPPLIRRVVIHNYKSIEKCDVTLGRFNVFVGRNGAGKSNFLDALQFVADALSAGLLNALEKRGGILNVLRRGNKSPSSFRIEIELQLFLFQANYRIEIAKEPHGGFVVDEESLDVWAYEKDKRLTSNFVNNRGHLRDSNDSDGVTRSISKTGLYLPVASVLVHYEEVSSALVSLCSYNLTPSLMRALIPIESGTVLRESGSNVASVVSRLFRERPATFSRVVEYIAQIVPGLIAVKPLEIGGYEILEFELQVLGESQPRKFQSQNMSDGTLRSLGVLVAALQFYQRTDSSHVIGIEEPESAIHPAAMAVLLDALREASVNNQILVTTHSPDLLDRVDMESDTLFVVADVTGRTVIAPIDRASESAIRDHLYTPGELLRMDQLEPRVDYPAQETTPQ